MTNVENLETWSMTLFYHTQAQVVNIQRCSIIILHNGGGEGGGNLANLVLSPFPSDKPTKRLQGVFADLLSRQAHKFPSETCFSTPSIIQVHLSLVVLSCTDFDECRPQILSRNLKFVITASATFGQIS